MESRTPPQNLEAEQSVLGSILLDNEVYATLEGTLRAEHFYKESHRKLFRAMERLFRRGDPIDLVTLTEELRQSSELDEVGNVPYLIGLADSVPTAAYAESYARIVTEKAVLRDLIGASGQIMQTAYDQAMPLEEILDASEKAIFELASSKRASGFGGMSELVTETFAHINELFANPDPVSGLRTGFKELDQMTAGLQPSSLNVLAARPSMGKCLTAGTLIDLPESGERIPIEAFVRRRHGCVFGVSDEGRLRRTRVSDWIDSGVKPAYRVTTRTGRRVETTGHHPFLAVGGWTPLHDLAVGDAIAVPRAVPAFGDDTATSLGRVRLLAYLIAEGGLSQTSPRFTNADPELVDDVRTILAGEFPDVELIASGTGIDYRIARPARPGVRKDRPNPVTDWLRELGLMGARAEHKFLPDVVWRWDRSRLAAFLGVLFSCDGTIYALGDAGRPRIEFTVASQRLAEDVHHALVRFGIVAKLWRKTERSWRVEITEPASVARYRSAIGWRGEKALDDVLRRPASDDLYWDEIVAIEPLGERQVYDLTVPDGANFVAADVCVHNTALALSMALNAALREKKTVGLFSLEMSGVQLVTRMLCSEARVDMSRVRNGQLTDRDFQRLADTAGRMSEARIFIDDNADMTVMELRSRARRLMAEHDLGLIVIDYLQLMSGASSGRYGAENRQQEISSISRGLKALARELDVPVLVLSQLSRAVESRPNKRPMLSDLRECVTGDTPVVLADGRRVPIEELVGQRPTVVAVDDGRLSEAVAEEVWSVGSKPVFELVTASGRHLRASAGHRVLAGSGWRALEDLVPGDRVALARRLPTPTHTLAWADHEVALLGQLIGDGSYLRGQPLRYTSASRENLDRVRDAATAMGSTVREYTGSGSWRQLSIGGNGNRWKARGVGGWLKRLGIFGQRSFEKRVPASAFELGEEQIGHLLCHLWATDGCIGVRGPGMRGSPTVYYATTSRGLADDVAALLLRLGIVARLATVPSSSARTGYRVHVSGTRDLRRFLEAVGAFGPRIEQAERLWAHLEGAATDTNRDTLPKERFELVRHRMRELGVTTRQMAELRGTSYGGAAHFAFAPSRRTMLQYAGLLADQRLADMASDDLYWDEVVAIRPVGRAEVFDLTVPGPASWLADGLVSHNSGAIEQDADLVMFIYRDEYYDPHSEKQGIAEILIGKQRNGPVGSLELQFHSAHVRFNDLARGAP